MSETNFYTYKDGSKCELCKSCLTMHINNTDPDTFMWLLEKFDVPWIPAEWNVLYERAMQKDPYKVNGMSVFGKYLSKMKLKQWNNFTFADTEAIQKEAEEKAKLCGTPQEQIEEKLAEMKEAHERGEISDAQWLTYQAITEQQPEFTVIDGAVTTKGPGGDVYPVNENPFEKVDIPDVGDDLTEEDKIYLAVKWGRLYSAADWVYLEQKYNDFTSSFDIQGAARIDTLIQICKLSLKLNQALDAGDMDTYAKLVRAYDTLMKSAKFTEAQNKDSEAGEFDSVGTVVAFCEKEGGFIPEYEIKADQDIIDTIIRDNHEYLNTLIHNDTHIAERIDQFLKKQEILAEQKADREKAKEEGEESIASTDQQYAEFYNAIGEDIDKDKEFISSLVGEEEGDEDI